MWEGEREGGRGREDLDDIQRGVEGLWVAVEEGRGGKGGRGRGR